LRVETIDKRVLDPLSAQRLASLLPSIGHIDGSQRLQDVDENLAFVARGHSAGQ
jgi:hypothetical protein